MFEFLNPAEGMDKIYEVADNGIALRNDPPKSEIIDAAHKELAEEKERIRSEEEKAAKKKELMERMKNEPFWHYCEVCGKKEFITVEEAYNTSWDYPPNMGVFGLLSPRKCGNCSITDTIFREINSSGKIPIVFDDNPSEEELITWRRIKGEPESLLVEEKI